MRVLLAGASGGIASAIGSEMFARGHKVWAISRSEPEFETENYLKLDISNAASVERIKSWLVHEDVLPDCVIQCAGILHDQSHMPEKRLDQISADWLSKTMQVNLHSHVHLAQAINPLVKKLAPLKWVSLSALVGSISENELGGWYSYRMSKAALNMFIRTLDIEWRRKSPDSIIVALHPGTTNTQLSKPFQGNIAPGKLYDVDLTASRLTKVIESLSTEQSGCLLHWDGSIVPY